MLAKKAQVSIEVLAILSILVVGAVLFGAYYLNTVNKVIGTSSRINDTDLSQQLDDPSLQPGNEITDPIMPAIGGQLQINAEFDPSDSQGINEQFDVRVGIDNFVYGYDNNNVKITTIEIRREGLLTPDCNYNGNPIIGGLLSINQNSNYPVFSDIILYCFSCSVVGEYDFKIYAEMDANSTCYTCKDQVTITKQISSTIPTDINLNLYLDPSKQTPQGTVGNHKFGVRAEVTDFTEGGDIYIKNIYVSEANNNEPTTNFYYGASQIPETGLAFSPALKMTRIGDDYDLLLPNFSSIASGKYDITITAGLAGTNARDINKFIAKNIDGLRLNLSLIPTDTNINQPFGVLATVPNYNSDGNLSIRHIKVWRKRISDYTGWDSYNGQCTYDGVTIPKTSGLNVDLNLIKYENDYNLLLNKFRCSLSTSADIPLYIQLKVHDNLETYPSSYDWNSTIVKQIVNPASPFCYFNYDGSGTQADPYVIKTAEDLFCVRYYLDSNFIVGNYIDLNHTQLSENSDYKWYDDVKGWSPIGTFSTRFTGSFDGNGNYINNLYSRRTEIDPNDIFTSLYSGLFLSGDGATFKNLNLTNIDINGHAGGGLIGRLYHGIIENVNVTGNTVGASAGLVGTIYDTNITGCSFTGNRINGIGSNAGGLIDLVLNQANCGPDCYDENEEHLPSYITDSYFSGNLSNNASFAGGLIGHAGGAIIDNCYTTGTVQAKGGCTGGLVGGRPISINNSYSNATVTGNSSTGGLLGCTMSGRGPIISSYSTGNIIATEPYGYSESYLIGGLVGFATSIYNSYSKSNIIINGNAAGVGGLVGHLSNTLNNSYSMGNINVSGTKRNVGGLIGYKPPAATLYNSYWDINTSGQPTSPFGGFGRTTNAMTYPDYPSTYVGWEFETLWMDDTDGTINDYYPYLIDPDTRGSCNLVGGWGSTSKQMVCDGGLIILLEEVTPSKIAETRKENPIDIEIDYKPLFYN